MFLSLIHLLFYAVFWAPRDMGSRCCRFPARRVFCFGEVDSSASVARLYAGNPSNRSRQLYSTQAGHKKTSWPSANGCQAILCLYYHSTYSGLEIDADNIALTSSTTSQIQQKARSHRTNSKGTGLKINSEKTRLLRLNTPNIEKVHVVGQDTEGVESFVCQQDRLYRR